MSNSIKDGLAAALQDVPVRKEHTLPEVIKVEMIEGGHIKVTPINATTVGPRLKTSNTLFLELRRKVRELTNDPSWTMRFASQVEEPMLPFLHSSSQLKVLIDHMSPYRNPVDALSKDGVLMLACQPSHVYYFHPKDKALHAAAKSRNSNRKPT